MLLAPSVNTLNSFSLLNPICCHLFEFSVTKFIQIQYFSRVKYENYEMNFIKSNLSITFQQHQVHLWIQVNFLCMILLILIKKMIQYSITFAL